MSLTLHKNIADAIDAQDATPLHQVQSVAAAAAVPATAGAVARTGHTAESVLISIAGTVSDLAVAVNQLVGRGPSGDVTALSAAAIKTLLAIAFGDITGTLLAAQFPALTGDVTTVAGALATTLANLPQSVLLARTALLSAAMHVNGQNISDLKDPILAQDAATKAYVLAQFSGGVPLTDGNKTDITVSASGATWLINALAVTFAKMQAIPTLTLIGRQSPLTGSPESIGVGGGIEFDGAGNLRRSAVTGDVLISAGSAGAAIAANAVTNAQLAQVPTGTLKGRTAAGMGNATDLTFAAVKTALAIAFLDVSGTLQAAQFPALTGDVTTTAGSLVTTLANTGVAVGTFGDGSHSLTIQVDAKGRVLAISAVSISIAAGAVSGLSAVQTGAFTGDVAKLAGSGVTTLVNIPDGVPVAGELVGTTRVAPATPAAGKIALWPDITDSIWKAKDENGNVTHMTRALAAVAHKFLTAINADGTVANAQPDFADLSGNINGAQLPVLANSLVGNNTGSTGPALNLNPARVRAMLGVSTSDLFTFGVVTGTLGTLVKPSSTCFLGPAAIFSAHLGPSVPRAYTNISVRINLFDTGFSGHNLSITILSRTGHAGSPTALVTLGPYGGDTEDSDSASGISVLVGDEINVELTGSVTTGDAFTLFVDVSLSP